MKMVLKTFGVSILLALALVSVVISIQISRANETMDSNFESMNEALCNKVFDRGYNAYMTDIDDNMVGPISDMYGSPLTDQELYDQFTCYLTCMNEGINSSVVSSKELGGDILAGVNAYYDADMNSIMKKNTLMLISQKSKDETSTGKRAFLYYTYHDDSLKEQMDNIIQKAGDNIGTVVFEVDGVYVKGHEFVPAEFYCYAMSESGSKTEEEDLYTTATNKEDMEAAGFEYIDISDSFLIGDTLPGSEEKTSIVYCGDLDSARASRVDELIKESDKLTPEDGRVFIKKKSGLFTTEYFSKQERSANEGEDIYYIVTYEKKNILFDFMAFEGMGGAGFLFVGIIIIEIVGALILGVFVGFVAYIVVRKKQRAS